MTTAGTQLDAAFTALRRDLINENGPQISTMRNYRFAIVPYAPSDEYKLRAQVQSLVSELTANGWVVLTLSLEKLLLERIRQLGPDIVERMIKMERRTADLSMDKGLNYLSQKICNEIEGPDGIAADVCREIHDFVEVHPDKAERTLVIVGRAGALYPFFRTSSLLKHIDGRTRNVPVVLLYPGDRRGDTGLSFMGVVNPDGDYRPRIYP
jgi:hypothetical protein